MLYVVVWLGKPRLLARHGGVTFRGKIRIFLLVEDLSEVYKSSEPYAKRPIEGSNKVTSSSISISISISGVTSHFF